VAKKFDEHLHQEKKDFDKGRMICMCEVHRKRICHCGCEHTHKWGCYDQLMAEGVFTEEEVIAAVKDYET